MGEWETAQQHFGTLSKPWAQSRVAAAKKSPRESSGRYLSALWPLLGNKSGARVHRKGQDLVWNVTGAHRESLLCDGVHCSRSTSSSHLYAGGFGVPSPFPLSLSVPKTLLLPTQNFHTSVAAVGLACFSNFWDSTLEAVNKVVVPE